MLNIVALGALACGGSSAGEADASVEIDAGAEPSISLVGMLELTGLPIHDVWKYTDEATGNDYALVCASSVGLIVADLADPANPVEVGRVGGGGVEATDVKTWRNYAYIVGEGPGVGGNIIDLANPASPTQVGTFPLAHNIFISESGIMALAAPGLRIYDLNADPETPVEIYSDNTCSGHDVAIVGDRLFDFSDDCGTRIYDIVDPANPSLLGTVVDDAFFHHSGWPSTDGNHLFLCDEVASPAQPDIAVWDIRDPAAPVKVDDYSDPNAFVHNLYVVGDEAYVSYYRAGFRVFDVSDPTQISLLDEYDTDPSLSGPGFGGNFGVYPFGDDGMILASDEANGLYIFKFGN